MNPDKACLSARTQYRAMFRTMAGSGSAWHLHEGSGAPVLLKHGATADVQLPLLVPNVHAMTEEYMVQRLWAALHDSRLRAFNIARAGLSDYKLEHTP